MTAAKSNGYHIKASRMFRTSSCCSIRCCSIRLYSGQNGRCTITVKNSKVRMSRYMDTSTITQMAQIIFPCACAGQGEIFFKNFGQVPGRADRNCGEWIALFLFFGSETWSLLAVNGKQKGSVREETDAVSGTTDMSVHNRHRKLLHPVSHQWHEVEVRRERGASEAGVRLGRPTDSRAKLSWRYLH